MSHTGHVARELDLRASPLLPDGFTLPSSRWIHPSTRLRALLASQPFVFAPGVYDPFTAQQAMYYEFPAVYFSGYSFAMGHLGSTDMDLYSSVEIADGARRTVSALRKFQLTTAVGDPDGGVAPRHLHIPPLLVDMDGGYGNAFNVARTTELYVQAGVAACHLEDQVLPKRFPDARFAFNWSSSFKWYTEPDPLRFSQLAELGYRFLFITLAAIHANGLGFGQLLQGLRQSQQDAYIELQRSEFADGLDLPTRSHHLFSGVPYHNLMGGEYGAARLNKATLEDHRAAQTV